MKRRSILTFFALLALAAPLAASPLWTLTWSDEGNGAANSAVDPTKWRADQGGGGWGNNELESYTNRTQNARYDGAGNLVIEARAEAYTGPDGIARNYTSARLTTGATFSQAYGRMEARMQIPYGQGMWPAFWMLGTNIGGVGWPTCGEIDIMENVGFEPNTTHGTIHGPGYSGANGIGLGYNAGSPISSGFHVYAVEWEPNIIRWYFDNVLYETRTPADLPGGTTWVYDHNFFMILNLAVGGAWPGNPDGSTVFPQQLKVDYVRVYQRDTTERPYNSALPIPGTIQASAYDDGGEGVAYHDTTVLNLGGAARTSDAVDLEACSDTGGGVDLGWTAAGEWLKYTVDVSAAGPYALRVRTASTDTGGTYHFTLDGAALAGSSFTTPNTGGWQTWNTLGPQTVTLPAGRHILGLVFDGNGAGGGCGNFNWFSFTALTTPTPTPVNTALPTASRTPTFTLTSTPSPTLTFNLPPTATRSSTLTVTRSATPSGTPSASPTATPTPSPTRSASPSSSATRTAAPTATLSSTVSGTPSLVASPAPSVSATPSPVDTPVPSATLSPRPADSATVSPTPLPPTASATATRTAAASATLTQTLTPQVTVTASATLSPASSPSSTVTMTLSPTATPTLSSIASSSPTPSIPPTVQATAPGEHDRVWLASNPQSGRDLHVVLESVSGLQDARVRIYSAALVLVAEVPLGAQGPGWHGLSLPADGLSNGLYWLKLADGAKSLGPPARVLVLR